MRTKFRLLFAVAATLSILLAAVVPASAEEKVKPIVVGMELAYPPFEMTDPQGKPTGISVDLATDLGKSLGRPVDTLIKDIDQSSYHFKTIIECLKLLDSSKGGKVI